MKSTLTSYVKSERSLTNATQKKWVISLSICFEYILDQITRFYKIEY
ncbi:hypothetical protein LEP1GSC116_4427, partial [Leptospira interrogans serovar Icterohaemorrhagiae str. Verdun HP]